MAHAPWPMPHPSILSGRATGHLSGEVLSTSIVQVQSIAVLKFSRTWFLMVRLSFWRSATFWHWQPGGMGFDQRWFLRDRSRDATASKAHSLYVFFFVFFPRWLHSLKTPVSSGCFLSSSCTYELSTDEGLKKAPRLKFGGITQSSQVLKEPFCSRSLHR